MIFVLIRMLTYGYSAQVAEVVLILVIMLGCLLLTYIADVVAVLIGMYAFNLRAAVIADKVILRIVMHNARNGTYRNTQIASVVFVFIDMYARRGAFLFTAGNRAQKNDYYRQNR